MKCFYSLYHIREFTTQKKYLSGCVLAGGTAALLAPAHVSQLCSNPSVNRNKTCLIR